MQDHVNKTTDILTRALDRRASMLRALEDKRDRESQQAITEDLLKLTHIIKGVTWDGIQEIARASYAGE